MVGKDVAEFKKSKSQWNTVAGASSIPLKAADIDVKAEPVEPKDEPVEPAPVPPKQATKRRGGLRTAAEMAAEAAAAAAANRSPTPEPDANRPDPTQTVHRDASGKVLDVEAMRAEAKRAEEEAKRKEKEKEEWSKGFTQRKEREDRERLLKEMEGAKVER